MTFARCLLTVCFAALLFCSLLQAQQSTPTPSPAATEQTNEIVCTGSTTCKTGFIPKFSSNGGSATVSNSVIRQSSTGNVGIGTSTPTQRLDLGNNGSAVVKTDPGNDTSAADVGYGLISRGAGGAPNGWWMFTAPVGGGFGVPANSFSIWQYPPNANPACCLQRFTILPAQATSDTGATLTIDQNGNASQARTAGGWVKAMVYVNAAQAPYTIIRCYNSTLAGAVATTPPCGFNLTEVNVGEFDVTFGFEIDDRFWSATSSIKNVLSTGSVAVILNADNMGSSQDIYVFVQDISGNPSNAYFNLIVY
jgi:hypothetical protein